MAVTRLARRCVQECFQGRFLPFVDYHGARIPSHPDLQSAHLLDGVDIHRLNPPRNFATEHFSSRLLERFRRSGERSLTSESAAEVSKPSLDDLETARAHIKLIIAETSCNPILVIYLTLASCLPHRARNSSGW